MPEIELSVMVHTPQTREVLLSLLSEFEAHSGVHVNLRAYQWNTARAELNKTALYHHGPDVSEIGSTWVSDLIAMNALRPFSKAECLQIGKPEDFLPDSWKSGQIAGDPTQWAIPWLAETFIIFYRRDLLHQAGIDESTAFESQAAIAKTAEALHRNGVSIPVEIPVQMDSFGVMHTLASWVWSAGGEFASSDGKRVLVNQPQAIEAVRAYFGLLRYLSPEARKAMRDRTETLFHSGDSAISFGTLMFYRTLLNAPKALSEEVGTALLPGQHFIGGSNLIVWKHTRNERAALELVRFLTSREAQERSTLELATLSPRLSALASPTIANHPIYRAMAESMRTGRAYESIPLWGLIEDRLVATLQMLGMAAIGEAPSNMEEMIGKILEALARKLNVTLSQ